MSDQSATLFLPSRRAVLAGAASTAAGLVVALTRPARLRGAVGDPLEAGSTVGAGASSSGIFNNSDTNGTWVVTQNGKGTALRGQATKGTGGRFSTGARNKFGLVAANSAADPGTGGAIQATGGANPAVIGTSSQSGGVVALFEGLAGGDIDAGVGVRALVGQGSVDHIHPTGSLNLAAGEFAGSNGLIGASTGDGIGVVGYSPSGGWGVFGNAPGGGIGVYATTEEGIGVYAEASGGGRAVEGVTVSGVALRGVSSSGHGVEAESTTGYAGYFSGAMYSTKFLDLQEQTSDPVNPGPNQARLFTRDNGAGKTQLCVRYSSGVAIVLSTQA